MSLDDLFHFVSIEAIIAKLGFIHDLVRGRVGGELPMQPVVESHVPVPENIPLGPPEVEI